MTDFLFTKTKTLVSQERVEKRLKSEKPPLINHIKSSNSRNAEFNFGKSITTTTTITTEKTKSPVCPQN